MIRLGLCCIFRSQPIKFRRTTARYLSQFSEKEQKKRLSEICRSNADNLMKAVSYCRESGIGGFRINSQILPLKTHPEVGYEVRDLPDGEDIIGRFTACGEFCKKHNIRTTFHPDQFIILSSPNHDVVARSLADLEYHAEVAEWVNADVINIHAGGVYNDKGSALKRLCREIDALSDRVRTRLTLENDDRSYTPQDLLPVCRHMHVPMVYDVHHHRCLRDTLGTETATEKAVGTWDREPLFHLSSPVDGWDAPNLRNHHDYIDVNDFPRSWLSLDITVEVEAKAKELAVLKLASELEFL
jgi:UV DNA damage endonuclease